MRITLDVPEEVVGSMEEIARARGVSPDILVADALRVCYPPITPELRAEIDEWQSAADYDAAKLGL